VNPASESGATTRTRARRARAGPHVEQVVGDLAERERAEALRARAQGSIARKSADLQK
jgi:hypothetical protein